MVFEKSISQQYIIYKAKKDNCYNLLSSKIL